MLRSVKTIFAPLLVAIFFLLNAAGCTSDLDVQSQTEPPNEAAPQTRGYSFPISQSGYFDWENEINIKDIDDKNIPLPWNAASNTTLPEAFLDDYYKEDGWELIYNDFKEENNNNIFMLYNIPRGTLRIFYRSNGVISYGEKLFGALSFNENTLILKNNNIPWSTNSSQENIYIPNKNAAIATGIFSNSFDGFGPDKWTVVEYDLSYYYNYPGSTFGQITFYSIHTLDFDANGIIDGQIDGMLTSSATYSNPGSKFTPGQLALDLANVVVDTKFLDQFFPAKDSGSGEGKTRAVGVVPAITLGVKALTAVIGGMRSKPQPQLQGFISNFSAKLSAKISLTGTITSRFNPVSKYFNLPGIDPALDGQYPDLDTKFGVWCLEEEPVVNFHQIEYTYKPKVGSPEVYTDNRCWLENNIRVKLNPDLEDKYEIVDLSYGMFYSEDIRLVVEQTTNFDLYQNSLYYVKIPDERPQFSWALFNYRLLGNHRYFDPPNPQIHVSFWLVEKETGKAVLHSRAIDYNLNFTFARTSSSIYMPLMNF